MANETEVTARAQRRRSTAAEKLRVLREADRCTKPGELGAVLRREGLYSSYQNRDSFKGGLCMRPALVMAVLVLTVAPTGVGQTQSARSSHGTGVEEAIRKLDNERIQAQIHADTTAIDRIYAADFIGVGPSGTVRTKPQVMRDFTSGDLKFQSITTEDVQVRVYGDTAVETGRSTMNGQDKGHTVPRDTLFTRVWVKQQGRWWLVANHYSLQITRQ